MRGIGLMGGVFGLLAALIVKFVNQFRITREIRARLYIFDPVNFPQAIGSAAPPTGS